jgi:hypothetical protein
MKGDPTFWLLARSSGLTAYVLMTMSVLAGLTVKSRPFGRASRPPLPRTCTGSSRCSDSECSRCTGSP